MTWPFLRYRQSGLLSVGNFFRRFFAVAAPKPGVTSKNRLFDTPGPDEREIAHLRHLDPELPEFAWRIISRYRPRTLGSQWSAVRPFVVEVVVSMRPTTPDVTRRLMTMVGRFAAWVWAVRGGDLTLDGVFTDDLVRRFVADQLASASATSRWDFTRQLATIAERLAETRVGRLPAPAPGHNAVPYSQAEIATMHSWASALPTELKRSNARATLGLAGGAGLTSAEIMEARVEDVQIVDGLTIVRVRGDRPRRVPVRRSWARTVARSIGDRTEGFVFRGYRLDEYPPRALQSFLTEHPCAVRPSPARFHLSWVIAQIDAGLPLDVLLEVSGFASPAALQPYLRHTRRHAATEYFDRIAGEATR